MILGFFFSLIVSVLFAVYAIPRKFSKQSVILYTMWMGVAYFFGTLVLVAIVWGFKIESVENLLNPYHLLTVLRGAIWVLGMAGYNKAIDKIGLTRFNQWKNIQGPVGSILILLFIPSNVVYPTHKLIFLLLGIAIMFSSAILFQIKSENELTLNNETLNSFDLNLNRKNTILGIIYALFCGVCFGITAYLNSWVTRPALVGGDTLTFSQLLYHSLSLIIFSFIAYLLISKEPFKMRLKSAVAIKKTILLPMIAGGMYMVATLLSIYSYRLISNNAIPWSITQLNVFWTVLIGIFFFKEISFKKHYLRLSFAILTAIIACVFLFLADKTIS